MKIKSQPKPQRKHEIAPQKPSFDERVKLLESKLADKDDVIDAINALVEFVTDGDDEKKKRFDAIRQKNAIERVERPMLDVLRQFREGVAAGKLEEVDTARNNKDVVHFSMTRAGEQVYPSNQFADVATIRARAVDEAGAPVNVEVASVKVGDPLRLAGSSGMLEGKVLTIFTDSKPQ